MKIPGSIRSLYITQTEVNKRLKEKVDPRIQGFKREAWHYESRLKQDQSFALKVESGRAHDPKAVEDVFACTLVVRNGTEIEEAEKLVRNNFKVIERRPADPAQTHKWPDRFQFDDLRLYVQWKADRDLPESGVEGVTFEVQIKTFLQHAWTMATHDLVYKTNNVNWGKQRIAYQVKAMLEHAELSIQEAERLAESSTLAKTDKHTEVVKQYIDLLIAEWQQADLPSDIRSLAENLNALMRLMNLRVEQLKAALDAEKAQGRGPSTLNLSPYGVVLQTLMNVHPKEFEAGLMCGEKHRQKIVIPTELTIPESIDKGRCKNAIFL